MCAPSVPNSQTFLLQKERGWKDGTLYEKINSSTYGHCIGLTGWIKSAAPAPEVFIFNPSPKGVISPNFFFVFVLKIMENGISLNSVDGEFSQIES